MNVERDFELLILPFSRRPNAVGMSRRAKRERLLVPSSCRAEEKGCEQPEEEEEEDETWSWEDIARALRPPLLPEGVLASFVTRLSRL